MKSDIFFGHHCPRCRSTVGISVTVGGEGKCPGCGGPLQAATGGPPTTMIANFKCEHCGARVGMLSAVGEQAACPGCCRPIV
jgi:transcription initiation factor IIE alpha subunit